MIGKVEWEDREETCRVDRSEKEETEVKRSIELELLRNFGANPNIRLATFSSNPWQSMSSR